MSFRVNKEVNGTTYVYETTGYWDKDKKQSRHKRVYLGKLDKETGEIIPPKKNDIVVPKLSKNYGNFFVIDKIANNIGLTDILKSVAYFGCIRTLIPETCGQHNGIIRTA